MAAGRTFAVVLFASYLLLMISGVAMAPNGGSQQGLLSPSPLVLDPSCTLTATVSSLTANFTGTISGVTSPIWTLHFGDGAFVGPMGGNVSAIHTYIVSGTYHPYLNVSYPTGGPATNCITTVKVTNHLLLSFSDSVGIRDVVTPTSPLMIGEDLRLGDSVGPGPYPLTANEEIRASDAVHAGPNPLQTGENVGIGDTLAGRGPSGPNESAKFVDAVQVVLQRGSGGTTSSQTTSSAGTGAGQPGFPGGLWAFGIGAAAVAGGAIVLWRVVLPRRR